LSLYKGEVDAVWQKCGEATTSRGDRIIWEPLSCLADILDMNTGDKGEVRALY
jgi:hypothetical protein